MNIPLIQHQSGRFHTRKCFKGHSNTHVPPQGSYTCCEGRKQKNASTYREETCLPSKCKTNPTHTYSRHLKPRESVRIDAGMFPDQEC